MSKMQKTQIAKESDHQVNLSNSGMTISQLNDDSLKCILKHLPFKDKLRLQRGIVKTNSSLFTCTFIYNPER